MRIGFLFPYQEMADLAIPIIQDQDIDVVYCKVVKTPDAVKEAEWAIEAGAEIIVARGYQAALIKETTHIPVVEMRIHSQEIGVLAKRAKTIIKKERPKVTLICFRGMTTDLSLIGQLFDIEFEILFFENISEIPSIILDCIKNGTDLFIGGENVCNNAQQMGYPGLIYRTSRESVLDALREIRRFEYARKIETHNSAQFNILMDTTTNGIIRVNNEAQIVQINKNVENLVGKSLEEVLGDPLEKLIPQIDIEIVRKVLEGSYENYSSTIKIKNQVWIIYFSPIQVGDNVTGAMLVLQPIMKQMSKNGLKASEGYLIGRGAKTTFEDLASDNSAMRQELQAARKYAMSMDPILIYSESGTEYYMIAEAIHNNSSIKEGPFVSINLCALDPEEQMDALFGKKSKENGEEGAMYRAQYGTLFIKGLDRATSKVQFQLAKLLNREVLIKTDMETAERFNVRIIASTDRNIQAMVERGVFSKELFYLFQGLILRIPPLRERKEDILPHFEKVFKKKNAYYNKYLVLSAGAQKRIKELTWPGNKVQIESFCNRLVLEAEKRLVDEVVIQRLYDSLYPNLLVDDQSEKIVIYQTPEEVQLEKLLEKFHGNRKLVAAELGISPTTLWRRMKKYGIKD